MYRPMLVILAIVAVIVPSTAQAARLITYPVPTGGFAVGLPPNWVDVTAAAAKSPSFAALANAVSSNGALKLIAADPASKGRIYMDAGVARVGTASSSKVANGTLKQLRNAMGKAGTITMTSVKLAAGPAYRLEFNFTKSKSALETLEFILVRNQVEYVLAYVAPRTAWKTHQPLFDQSAKAFRFLPTPNLTDLVLPGPKVGAGYAVKSYPTGDSIIGTTTLDLCGASYASEAARTGRLQVAYSHPAKAVDVSNEVVTYVAGGAQQALREVRTVAASCAKKSAVFKQGKVTTTFSVKPVTGSKLLPGSVAVEVITTQTDGKKRVREDGIAIYQVKGNTFTGVYTFVTPGTTIADATRVAFHAAEASAQLLSGVGFSA